MHMAADTVFVMLTQRHFLGLVKKEDITRFRKCNLKGGVCLLEFEKNSTPNAFSITPSLNINQSFIMLKIKLCLASKTQREINTSLAANSIMNATTIFEITTSTLSYFS